jgi:trigger factor
VPETTECSGAYLLERTMMEVSVENVSSVKKTLHIEVPEKEVVRELDKAYNELKKKAKVRGFRPGKVPRSVLVRLYKKDVHADVTSRLIQTSFLDALKETDLKIVGSPKVDPPELNADGPYKYDATVEISPEIDEVDFSVLSLKRTNYQYSEEEIEAQLKMLQKNMAQHRPVEPPRAAQKGDYILIDFEGFKDGRPFSETPLTKDFNLKLGEGPILAEFDDQLAGMQPGETKEFSIKFPGDYNNKTLADLDISFRVTLKEVREEVLPAIDDELAKKTGQYESLEELKKAIADNLQEGYTKRTEQELHEQIYKELLSRTEFEVPDALVDMELEGILEEAERSFSYRNISMEELGISRESLAEQYRDTALNQVKRHLLLSKLIEQKQLALDDEELESALAEMAASFNQPVEEIKKFYDQSKDKLEYLKHTLLEKKAIKLIIDSSKIEDVEPEKADAADSEKKSADSSG